MRLKIVVPEKVILEEDVVKVVADSMHGSFCVEERHVDYVAPLAAGILSFVDSKGGEERFVGTAEGLLVKVGDEVLVSLHDAVHGVSLGEIRETVRERLRQREERIDRVAAVAEELEARLVRRFAELGNDREANS